MPVREFGNLAKTQGIWFAQVVKSLILKVKDILKFAAKIAQKNFKLDKSAKSSFVYVTNHVKNIVTNHVNCHRENLPSEKTVKTDGIEKCNLSGYPTIY